MCIQNPTKMDRTFNKNEWFYTGKDGIQPQDKRKTRERETSDEMGRYNR